MFIQQSKTSTKEKERKWAEKEEKDGDNEEIWVEP